MKANRKVTSFFFIYVTTTLALLRLVHLRVNHTVRSWRDNDVIKSNLANFTVAFFLFCNSLWLLYEGWGMYNKRSLLWIGLAFGCNILPGSLTKYIVNVYILSDISEDVYPRGPNFPIPRTFVIYHIWHFFHLCCFLSVCLLTIHYMWVLLLLSIS